MDKQHAYGGVVISSGNRVLLRESSQHHGGYAWTFAKTAAIPWRDPQNVALKAVREKTGYACTVRAAIPGFFDSDDTIPTYFLMEASHPPAASNWQSSRLRCARFEEARTLIRQSSNVQDQNRDLAVLDAAMAALKTIP